MANDGFASALALRGGFGQSLNMPKGTPPARPLIAVRILALVCVVLAVICMALAWAWASERQSAACWRTAAQFQLVPDGDCGG